LIRTKVQELLAGYIRAEAILAGIGQYIVPPGLGNQAGVLGAIALAQQTAGGR
jgi:fructokinase